MPTLYVGIYTQRMLITVGEFELIWLSLASVMHFQEPYVCLYSRRLKFPRGRQSRLVVSCRRHLLPRDKLWQKSFSQNVAVVILHLKVYFCCYRQILHKYHEIIQLWKQGNCLTMKCVVYVSMILTQATLFVKLLRFYFTRVQHKYSFQAPLFGSCGCNSWSSDQKVAGFDPWACRMNGYYPPQWTEPGGQNKEEVTTNPFTYFAKWVAHAPVRQSDPDRQ